MDEKQKKTLIIIGVVLVVLMVITAVLLIIRKNRSSSNGSDGGNTVIPSGKTVELAYWGLWEPTSVMQPIIDEFENKYPNIKIQYSQSTFTNYESRLYTRLQQASSSNDPAPDIFRIHNSWLPKYYSYLSPLPHQL